MKWEKFTLKKCLVFGDFNVLVEKVLEFEKEELREVECYECKQKGDKRDKCPFKSGHDKPNNSRVNTNNNYRGGNNFSNGRRGYGGDNQSRGDGINRGGFIGNRGNFRGENFRGNNNFNGGSFRGENFRGYNNFNRGSTNYSSNNSNLSRGNGNGRNFYR